MKDELGPGSVPDRAPIGNAVPFVRMSVSDPLENSGLIKSEDVVPKLVPLEPLEHSVPEEPQSRGDGLVSDMDTQIELRSACLSRVASDAQGVDVSLLDDLQEADRSRTETGEAIVVGAIGSAAEHSVLDANLDSRPMKDELGPGLLEHSVPDRAPIGGAVPFIRMSVSDPLEHSALINSEDVVPKLVPLEPLEHSVPEEPQLRGDGLVSDMDTQIELRSACLPRVASDAQGVDVPLLDDRP